MNEISLQNGKKIWLKALSVRRFELKTNHLNTRIVRDESNNFVEIKFSELLTFVKNDKITIKDRYENYLTYTLNDISMISKGRYDCTEEAINKSAIFILPFLGNNHVYFDYGYSLYNVQISEDYSFLYLKYKFIKNDKYLELEQNLQEHPLYMEFFDIDKEFVMFKFKIPEAYKLDAQYIIDGKYSKIKSPSKNRILAFHGFGNNSKLGSILSKNPNYKKKLENKLNVNIPSDIDLMSKGIKAKEIWNYQKILDC